jgi:8-oxo-dGTP diphosphatase
MLFPPEETPESFYRVSVKALIYDTQHRLLMYKDDQGRWEVPGGGWDHGETFEQCIVRELTEEIHATDIKVGALKFFYRGVTLSGYPKVNLAIAVSISSSELRPSKDGTVDLVEAKFVTKEEFLALPFQAGEELIAAHVDQIWP